VEKEKKQKGDNLNNKILKRLDEIAESYAAIKNKSEFAQALTRQVIFNPNQKISTPKTFTKYTREQIIKWLQNPASNEQNLRNASIYLYLSSMQFQRLIAYFAGLPLWQYVLYPKIYESPQKPDALKKQYHKVADILKAMSVPQTGSVIATTVLRDGVYFGVRHLGKGGSFIQRLNPDICQIAYIQEGVPLFKVDMSKISEKQLEFYPTEFEKMFKDSKAGGDAKWQEVPSEISVCVKFDLSTIEYSVPPFSAVLPGLYKIADAEDRHDVFADQKNIKMIFAKAPMKEDESPAMDFDLFLKYYNHLANQLPPGIGLGASPFATEAIDFNKSGATTEIDDIARTTDNFWSSAGTSPILHGASNSAAGSMKLVIKSDESFIGNIVKQIERVINAYLEIEVGGKIPFNIMILPTTVFNLDDYIARYKEGATLGIGKLLYMASLGVSQVDFEGMSFVENQILELDKRLNPLKNTYNTGENERGRPLEDEEDLEPSGVATRDGDTNENR